MPARALVVVDMMRPLQCPHLHASHGAHTDLPCAGGSCVSPPPLPGRPDRHRSPCGRPGARSPRIEWPPLDGRTQLPGRPRSHGPRRVGHLRSGTCGASPGHCSPRVTIPIVNIRLARQPQLSRARVAIRRRPRRGGKDALLPTREHRPQRCEKSVFGFMMPSGSSADLIARIAERSPVARCVGR